MDLTKTKPVAQRLPAFEPIWPPTRLMSAILRSTTRMPTPYLGSSTRTFYERQEA